MKVQNKIRLLAVGVVIVAICIIIIELRSCAFSDSKEDVARTETIVKPTPVNLDSIKRIGQWSVVSVRLDQIVDTVDKGFFRDHKIQVMYHGTLHYGIDMTKVGNDWVTIRDDTTVYIRLPKAQLLDDRFLDERNVEVIVGDDDQKFINRPEVRAALVQKAKAEMIRKGDTHKDEAQKKVESELRRIFTSHGYKKVIF